jgi:PAS domain S-box-containing protein
MHYANVPVVGSLAALSSISWKYADLTAKRENSTRQEMMKRPKANKDQLIEELTTLRTRLAELERMQAEHPRKEEQLKHSLDETRQRREQVAALLDGSRAVLQYTDFQEAARAIFESCKKLIGATAGYVALLTNDGSENEVLFLDSGGLPCYVDPSLPMPIRGLRAEAYRKRAVVYDNDFANSKWVKFMPDGHVALDNVMFAPLVIEGEAHGLLGLANKPGGFSEDDARIAGAFGELATISLLNTRTLQSLEKSEEMLRSVVETATDAIVTGDSNGNVVFWNESAERIFGYSEDEIVGRPVADLMPERFRNAHREQLARVVSTGKTTLAGRTMEITGLRRDGSEFPLELSLAAWETGENLFFTALCRDITQRKRAEEALKRGEERYALAQRASNIGSWDWDIPSGDLHWSERIEPLFGFEPGQFGATYEAFLDCVHPADRQYVIDSVNACIEQGTDYAIEHRIVWPDGTVRWVSETGDAIRDRNGEPARMAGIVQDITERKKAEDALRASRRFLEIANQYSGMNPLLAAFVAEIKELTDCDAVGVRVLDDQGNIPYEVYDGFSQDFYELENPLSIKLDACKCSYVIRGEADPNLPFYTEHGSFFMNGTTRFLATISEEERKRTRNRCSEYGYESLALVPIRVGELIIGLIHVADTRDDMVPLEKVEMLEGIAKQLGVAIQRARAEEEIGAAARFLIENPHPMLRIGKEGTVLYANSTGASLLSESADSIGQPAPELMAQAARKVLDSGLRDTLEIVHGEKTFSFTVAPVRDAGYVNLYGRDVTERKRAEEELDNAARFPSENPYPVLRVAHDGTVLYANKASLTLLRQWQAPVGRSAPGQITDLVKRTLDTGSGENLEIEHEGRTFWFAVVPVKEAGYVNLYGRDVTERKRAEQELRRHEQHLEELVKERTAELERSHQELRELAAHVQTAREEERTSVAREIHDELGQVLTGLHMGLSWLDTKLAELENAQSRGPLLGKIDSMSSLVDRTIESVQRIAAELRPGVLDDFGLIAAIESHARKFQEQTGIRCNVVLVPGSAAFDDATSTALFRIVQETLTNVARHANATNVAITFKHDGNELALVVKDNGRGIQGSAISRSASLGLLGMRERAAALGGQFQVTSVTGKGTTVKVVVPVAGVPEGQESIDSISSTDPKGGAP